MSSPKMDYDESLQENIGEGDTKRTIYTWIADYVFQEAWKEFSTEFTIDADTGKRFISGFLEKVSVLIKDDETVTKFRVLYLMALLCDAKNGLTEEGKDVTYLEEAYNLLQTEMDLEDDGALAEELRLQAVLSCCRCEEWDLAAEIYERLWIGDDSGSRKKVLEDILKDRSQEKALQIGLSYDTFLQTARGSLANAFVVDFRMPFLQRVCLKMADLGPDSQSTCDGEFSTPLQTPPNLSDAPSQRETDNEQSYTGQEGNTNYNNSAKDELMQALEIEPRMTRGRQKSQEKTEETTKEVIQGTNNDVEISFVEVSRRELRSRTVPGYLKQMVLKSPKKTEMSGKEENDERNSLSEEFTENRLVIDEPQTGLEDSEQRGVSNGLEDKEAAEGRTSQTGNNGMEGSEGFKDKRGRGSSDGEADGELVTDELKDPPVTGIMLRDAFSKLGHGSRFWYDVDKDLSCLHKKLLNLNEKRSGGDKEGRSEERIDLAPSASSTPNKSPKPKAPFNFRTNRGRIASPNRDRDTDSEGDEDVDERSPRSPVASGQPTKLPLTFTKPLPVSSRLPSKKILAKNSTIYHNGYTDTGETSGSREEAGPSHSRIGRVHEGDSVGRKRRHRLRDLEKSCDEDGEKVSWTSSSDSDSSIDSMISKASLKSPKLRKSLELVSVKTRRAWTKDEVRLLIKGVARFGVGHWAEIVSHYDIDRTNVNLKDKWRDLVKRYKTTSPSKMKIN